MFKRTQAISIEKMGQLNKVLITEDKVSFSMNYSNMEFKVEEIPKLLSDIIQLYAMVKPSLDRKAVAIAKERVESIEETGIDEPINLDDIPFE